MRSRSMNLIRYTYFPGFAYDLTNWDSTIDESGLIRQHVNPECRKTKRKHRPDIRERQLDEAELYALLETLNDFDTSACEAFKDLPVFLDDAEQIGLHSELFGFSFSGHLLSTHYLMTHRGRELGPAPLESLIKLWRHVDRLQPRPAGAH